MIEINIDESLLESIKSIVTGISNTPEVIDLVAEDAIKTLRLRVQGRTPIGETGKAQAGWTEIQKSNNGGYSFENRVPYINVLNRGGYSGLGPRTTIGSGGVIFSSRVVDTLGEGIVEPILQDQEFLRQVVKYLAEALMKGITNAGT